MSDKKGGRLSYSYIKSDVNNLVIAVFVLYVAAALLVNTVPAINRPVAGCLAPVFLYLLPTFLFVSFHPAAGVSDLSLKKPRASISFWLLSFLTLTTASVVGKYVTVFVFRTGSGQLLPATAHITGKTDLWYVLLVGAVMPAVCEELLVRGAVLSFYRRQMPAVDAVVLSAVVFAMLHFSGENFLSCFFAGIVLGVVTLVSDSVFPAMLLHGANNVITLFTDDILSRFATESRGGVFALLVFFCLLLIFLCLLLHSAEKLYLSRAIDGSFIRTKLCLEGRWYRFVLAPTFIFMLGLYIVITYLRSR